ncbi:MAG: peptidylprolyl isomerase [candidate division KSB1 bacterium]|nr:peptidylprolyl isomerase [candidate division KSB1 bacterium]MDZ7276364.1 peptidylprolyl isomerase [candidate division KSB1 bacterium]MDZ7287684.1 peptidylprolyl isomerase [candidate division KSB1 bacterium]MDZ7299976.1 peptidylprolyl isomerase [candidate division KSB1 bacterium]MDZ7307355.1 peptidylprolyl isomerase [candidate division KSB1 bacterium]
MMKTVASRRTSRFARAVAALCLLFLPACQGGHPPLVAEWREIRITQSDFERSYFQYWQTTSAPDSPALRRHFAQQMIEQELIARAGMAGGLHRSAEVQRPLQRDFRRFLRRRYLEVTLQDTLTEPTAAEIAAALQRQNTQLRVRQLFARSAEEIQRLQQQLQQGMPFEKLAAMTMPDSTLAASGGDLGWLGWGDTDLPVEEVLYQLPRGAISAPVSSLMGWHIFRVDSIRTTLRFGGMTPWEREDIYQRLLSRRLDLAAARHLRGLVWSKPLVVNMAVLARVWERLAPIVRHPAPSHWPQALQKLERDPPFDLLQEIAATVAGEPFTVQEFLEALPEIPRQLLQPNLKKALELAIRDRLLTQAALAAGLANDPVVREKMRRAELQYTYYATLAAQDSVVETAAALQRFYAEHRARYGERVESEVYEILVAQRDSALAIAKAIQAGRDFGEMARRHSRRAATREQGGFVGILSDEDKPLGQQAAQLRPGELYAPVATAEGYSVIRVGRQIRRAPQWQEIEQRVREDWRRADLQRRHQSLLPADYRPQDIKFHEENLARALTQRGTVF